MALFLALVLGFSGVASAACGARAAGMNSLNVIAPYKYHGRWVFDDPRAGLNRKS